MRFQWLNTTSPGSHCTAGLMSFVFRIRRSDLGQTMLYQSSVIERGAGSSGSHMPPATGPEISELRGMCGHGGETGCQG